MKNKIKDFTDLIVWQKAHKLVILIYGIAKKFPRSETYALANQLKRAVVSVTSNIAEGFSRQTSKEKIQFYFIASGSLTEVRNQLTIARDLDYIKGEEFSTLNDLTTEVSKMIYGLINTSFALTFILTIFSVHQPLNSYIRVPEKEISGNTHFIMAC